MALAVALGAAARPQAAFAAAPEPTVLTLRVDGPISYTTADQVADALAAAVEGGHDALVIELDTPGGLVTSMRQIVQDLLAAEVPVIVHVTPPGARAASAGALITFGAHVAAMAPGTTIGAATPVGLQGGDVDQKVVNDMAAFAEAVAGQRGRNVEFAEATVREARAVPAEEAVRLGAVDLLAADRDELLTAVDGSTVQLAGTGPAELRTAGATAVEFEQGVLDRIQAFLANPTLAFVFLALGALGLLFELASPGVGIGGVGGAILLLLGLVGLSILPVDAAGVALLGLAVALFVAELFAPGVGVFAAGGAISLGLAGLFLYEGRVDVEPAVLWPTAAVVGLGSLLAGRLALRARRRRPVSGVEALVGRRTVVSETTGEASGRAQLDETAWSVRSSGEPLRSGQSVQVVAVEGNTLVVEPSSVEEP